MYKLCKMKDKDINISFCVSDTPNYMSLLYHRHKKMTEIPQLYKTCLPYSDAGETDLNLQEYFNHKCNQKLDYNKALLGEILGRAP